MIVIKCEFYARLPSDGDEIMWMRDPDRATRFSSVDEAETRLRNLGDLPGEVVVLTETAS